MLYIIVGPTGSHKTSIACQLSDMLENAPIISVDAFQIYKDMNIGTAKISKDSPYYKRHYLIDICSPSESYSVKEYQSDFRNTYSNLSQNHKDVIVCGGTGLYLRAALYDYVFPNEIEQGDTNFDSLSNEELYEKLKEIDSHSALTIHPNNRKRVIRALSIALKQDKTKSENISLQEHQYIYPKENIKIFFINPSRDELYQCINDRVDKMFDSGLIDEVKELLDKYQLSQTASQAIGYKEIIAYLNNEILLDTAIELIKKRSRNYAKRQVTFFKHQFDTIEINESSQILEIIKNER